MAIKSGLLPEKKVHQITDCFAQEDATAADAAVAYAINRNTANAYFKKFRIAIYQRQIEEKRKYFGSYFYDSHFDQKTQIEIDKKDDLRKPIIGILRNNEGTIFTELIPDLKSEEIRRIMLDGGEGNIFEIVDGRIYSGLIDPVKNLVFHIDSSGKISRATENEDGSAILEFWRKSKKRLKKFKGFNKQLDLHMKDCEWRAELHYDFILHLTDLIKYKR